jgi:hypothetical protein
MENAACSLSYGSDILVAINGMTQMVGLRNGLSSIAGLWEQYLLPEHLWHRGSPETPRPDFFDPILYYTPTLSSACVTRASNKFSDLVRGQSEKVPVLFMSLSYTLEWEA